MFWAVSGTISCTAMGVALQIEFLSMVLVGSAFCAAVCGIYRPNRLCWRFVSLGAQAAAISVFSF